jgi:hypothetical protein
MEWRITPSANPPYNRDVAPTGKSLRLIGIVSSPPAKNIPLPVFGKI